MPPTLHLVRHAEGCHNVNHAVHIHDATLTHNGKLQCLQLQKSFPHHNTIDLVLSSPLRRAIQTAILSFGPTLARPEVPYLVIPAAQEVSNLNCDVGHPRNLLEISISQLFGEENLGFSLGKINLDAVEDGWNSKTGYWASEKAAIEKRAADLRTWLFQRPESHVLLVTHGAFLHYLTEDWTGDDPVRGTAYLNCEVRQFNFTPSSSKYEAHIVEAAESKKSRGASHPEDDPHVLEELGELEKVEPSRL
ncbi:phosphoglycerate mutase-like protein [Lindgomyces ingoldianus]|uniref:Phosphoglycerate mutase-like protein n=1 Tax=Lindgomyces ingoldianus TaxID=673940 RepID=A0ACB6QQY1_9PLEO|nr:phosphoglycerate mutase-like protein [Lindgomyces ingoldianus]KAF2468576.1 phosphoglycerate mutase-like protein [Lindgomyces ingoldianus]